MDLTKCSNHQYVLPGKLKSNTEALRDLRRLSCPSSWLLKRLPIYSPRIAIS